MQPSRGSGLDVAITLISVGGNAARAFSSLVAAATEAGTIAGTSALASAGVPQNTVEIGFYLTHGDYTLPGAWNPNTRTHQDRRATNLSEVPRVRNEFGHRIRLGDSFSGYDISAINSRGNSVSGYRGYLGTPSRVFYYFDLGDRNQSVLFRHSQPPLRN